MNNQDYELSAILENLANSDDIYNQEAWVEASTAILAWHNKQLHELDKAYGGCHNCYGKGYSTVKSQTTGYGTDGDIGGFEGPIKVDKPVEIKYCDCDRGKQLERAVIEARIDEGNKIKERMQHIIEVEYFPGVNNGLNAQMTGHGAMDFVRFAISDRAKELSKSKSWAFTNDDISWLELLKEIVNDLVVDPWESA